MNRHLTTSALVLAAATLLCGLVYPLLVTMLAGALFPRQATGSIVVSAGQVVGSELIGQQFVTDRFFHARPSAVEYRPIPSGASNLFRTSRRLVDSVAARRVSFLEENGLPADSGVPEEMLCSSGSGIDPHISIAAALAQCPRVARGRGDSTGNGLAFLRTLVVRRSEYPFGEFFGGGYVNVFLLNLDLSVSDSESCVPPEKR